MIAMCPLCVCVRDDEVFVIVPSLCVVFVCVWSLCVCGLCACVVFVCVCGLCMQIQ